MYSVRKIFLRNIVQKQLVKHQPLAYDKLATVAIFELFSKDFNGRWLQKGQRWHPYNIDCCTEIDKYCCFCMEISVLLDVLLRGVSKIFVEILNILVEISNSLIDISNILAEISNIWVQILNTFVKISNISVKISIQSRKFKHFGQDLYYFGEDLWSKSRTFLAKS